MQIQPITFYSTGRNCNVRSNKANVSQPNFRGLKGFLAGGAIGSGLTAAGITALLGAAALPAAIGYIVVNGVVSAASGHMIQDKINKDT